MIQEYHPEESESEKSYILTKDFYDERLIHPVEAQYKIPTSRKDFYEDRIPEACPTCGCKHYIKYGKYYGIQRYKCKDCRKTFSKTTNSLWSYSKKNPKLWLEFIKLMFEKRSLRFSAEKLQINLLTAFYWRHKILNGLALNGTATPSSLKGVVYMAKMIMPESSKGCKNIKMEKKRDYDRSIWIIGAKGDEDSMFAMPVFRENWDFEAFNEKVYSRIDKKSYIIPCGDRYLEIVAKKHNKNRKLEVKYDERISHFILNLLNWLEPYHGIATKYLKRYLSFFVLFNLDKVINHIDFMHNSLLFENIFMKINDIRVINNIMY